MRSKHHPKKVNGAFNPGSKQWNQTPLQWAEDGVREGDQARRVQPLVLGRQGVPGGSGAVLRGE